MRRDSRADYSPPARISQDLVTSRVRLLGVVLVCAKVALVPVVFDHSADVPFTVTKALLSHALACVLAAVLVALFLRFRRAFLLWTPLHIPVVSFLVISTIATALAADRELALYGTHVRMLGLGTIADWVITYLAVVLLLRTRAEAVFLIASTVAGGVLVLGYEVIQLLGRDPFSWNMDVTARPFGTLGQPTTLALYLTTLALGLMPLGVFAPRLTIQLRAVSVLTCSVFLAGAAATGTRSAILGIAAGSALLVVMIWAKHPSQRSRWLSLAAGITATLVIGGLIVLTPLGSRLSITLESAVSAGADDDLVARLEPSAAGRLALYEIAFQMVRERPVLGYGPDSFPLGVARYRSEDEPREIQQSLATSGHSWIAYVATGSGLLGLAAFLSISIVAFVLTFRGRFDATTAAAGAMLAAFLGTGLTTVSDVGTDWLFWLSVAAIARGTARSNGVGAPTPAHPRLKGRKARSIAKDTHPSLGRLAPIPLIVGLILGAAEVNAFIASRSGGQAKDARLSARIPEAIQLGLQATTTDPRRAAYWHDLGLAYVGAARWADASEAFKRAQTLEPYDVRHAGDLARAQLFLAANGDVGARASAIALGEKAVQTDPNNPLAQLTRTVVMQSTGNLAEAARSIDRALALDPDSNNFALYRTAAQVYIAVGRYSDAIRVGRQGIGFISLPATVPLRIEVARALLASGQSNEALAEIDAALATQPDQPSALQLRDEIRRALQK
jgi:O-antigen ligase/Flp pilus assembly protein TadD